MGHGWSWENSSSSKNVWEPKGTWAFQGAKLIWLTVGQTPDLMALYWTLSEELGLKPELNTNAEDYKLKLDGKECFWFWMMFGKTKHLIHLT